MVSTKIKNIGTGTMPVEVAFSRGERFPKKKEASSSSSSKYREARKTVTLGAGESAEVTITCDFEPERVVVDPDAKVLMLGRKAALFNHPGARSPYRLRGGEIVISCPAVGITHLAQWPVGEYCPLINYNSVSQVGRPLLDFRLSPARPLGNCEV